jgi:hypothetical protein
MTKKTILVAVFGLFLVLTACTKKKADLIVGKWEYEKLELPDSIKNSTDPNMQMGVQFMENMMKSVKMEFTKDGKYIVTIMENKEEGTYTVDEKESKLNTKSSEAGKEGFMNGGKITKLDETSFVLGEKDVSLGFKKAK